MIFTGYINEEEKKNALAATDIFILSSQCEGFGLVILEAWAQRKPVIVTRSGGPEHVINEGENGFIVDYMNISQLYSKINIKIVQLLYQKTS